MKRCGKGKQRRRFRTEHLPNIADGEIPAQEAHVKPLQGEQVRDHARAYEVELPGHGEHDASSPGRSQDPGSRWRSKPSHQPQGRLAERMLLSNGHLSKGPQSTDLLERRSKDAQREVLGSHARGHCLPEPNLRGSDAPAAKELHIFKRQPGGQGSRGGAGGTHAGVRGTGCGPIPSHEMIE